MSEQTKCSICDQPIKFAGYPYCESHEKQFGCEWEPCGNLTCVRPVPSGVLYCFDHGGQDYAIRTTAPVFASLDEAQQDDIDRIIENYGEQLLEGINAAEAVGAWLRWITSARARLPRLTCAAGPTCFRLCIDGSDFCELHKCETKGCTNQRHRAFHHCEVHP